MIEISAGHVFENAINCISDGFMVWLNESLPLCKMPFEAIQAAFFILGTNSGTNSDTFGMSKDHKKNLPYKPATLRDRKKDLSKEWYIEWYAFDESTNDLIRKRKKIPMSFRDVKSRTQEANRMISAVNSLLADGYHFKKSIPEVQGDTLESENELVKALNYILSVTRSTLAPKTANTYQSAINKLEAFSGEKVLYIHEFSNQKAIHFRDHLISQGNTSRTANNTLQHLSVVFSKYMERTGAKENPFKLKSLKVQATNKNIAFTDEDRVTIENHMLEHEPELFLVTRFIYQAFIRPGELLKIKVNDIKLIDRYILVHGLISKNGKTETAPIIQSLAKEIVNRVDFSKPDKYLFSLSMRPGYSECSKQVPFRRHEKILKELGLHHKGYTLYSWKHTGAVNAYRAGVGIKELQNMLRHSSIQITDIYLKSLGLRTDPKLQEYNW